MSPSVKVVRLPNDAIDSLTMTPDEVRVTLLKTFSKMIQSLKLALPEAAKPKLSQYSRLKLWPAPIPRARYVLEGTPVLS